VKHASVVGDGREESDRSADSKNQKQVEFNNRPSKIFSSRPVIRPPEKLSRSNNFVPDNDEPGGCAGPKTDERMQGEHPKYNRD
jgi:hypothetical protein